MLVHSCMSLQVHEEKLPVTALSLIKKNHNPCSVHPSKLTIKNLHSCITTLFFLYDKYKKIVYKNQWNKIHFDTVSSHKYLSVEI